MTLHRDGSATDDELVSAARRGDRAAMESLLRRHTPRIHSICRRITANPTDADDATQETLIKVVRSLDKFDGRSSVSTWIHRIATNTALDEIRRRRRRPALSLVEDSTTGNDPVDTRASAAVEDLASQMILDEAIAALPEDQRAAVVLRDSLGLDYGHIAEVLGVAPGTVKSRISRARQRLMEDLADRLGDGIGNQTRTRERLMDSSTAGRPNPDSTTEPASTTDERTLDDET
jgi:RNA polymerase sigma-70 factor (ECF subfamily)